MYKLARNKRLIICILSTFIIISGLALVSCSKSSPKTNDTASSMTGVASKGLITNAIINVYALDTAGNKGSLLGTAITDTIGAYNVNLGTYTGNVLVEAIGGAYIDEATGLSTTNTAALRTAVENVSGSVKVAVTPMTEIAVQMAGTLTQSNIDKANITVSNMIGGTNIITTMPADVLDPSSQSRTTDETNYGLVLAAISQMVSSGTATSVAEAITQIANDLANNELDITGGSISSALTTFITSTHNQTGLTSTPAQSSIASYTDTPIQTTPELNFIDISKEFKMGGGITYPDTPAGLTWDGTYFWVSNYAQGNGNNIIYKYDKTTGVSVGSIPSPSAWTDNLCFDGNNLWLTDALNGKTIFKISMSDGSIISSFTDPTIAIDYGQPRGLAWDAQYIYYAKTTYPSPSTSTIYKIDPITGASLGVIYTTTKYAISGLTFKDNSLWFLSRSTSDNIPSKIVNITLDGVELSAVNLPSTELTIYDQITGLTNANGELWYLRALGLTRGIVKFNQ